MKGAVMLELIIVVVIVCCLFIAITILTDVWNDVTDADPVFSEYPEITAEGDQIMEIFGFMPILMFAGSIISMIILSFYQESHPVFLGLSIIVFIISIPLMAILSNSTMGIVTSDTGLTMIAEGNEASTQMIGNLVLWGIGGGLLVLVVLYGKMPQR